MNKRAIARMTILGLLAFAVAAGAHPHDEDVKFWTDEGGKVWTGEEGEIMVFDDDDGFGLFDGDDHIFLHADDGQFSISLEDQEGAYLGVTLSDVDEELADEMGLKDGKGAMVQSVFDDTPAEEAGIEAGDVVVKFDGKDVEGVGELVDMVRSHDPGDKVEIEVRREGKNKEFKLELTERDSNFTVFKSPRSLSMKHPGMAMKGLRMPQLQAFGMGKGRLGVQIRDLDKDLAEYFPGVDQGALILEVMADTPAEEAGLKAGDVITRLGDQAIESASDLREAVSDLSGEEEIQLEYLRKGKKKSAAVTIEDDDINIFINKHMDDVHDHRDRIVERIKIGGDDLEEKMEKLEKKLKKLEKKLEDMK